MTLSSTLVQAFKDHPLGLCGQHDPAKSVSSVESFEQRLSILTFGVVLDAKHLSQERWFALTAIHDHWLLDPSQVAYQSSAQVLVAMRKHLRISTLPVSGGRFAGAQAAIKAHGAIVRANNDNVHTLRAISRTTDYFPGLAGPVISHAGWIWLTGLAVTCRVGKLGVPLPSHQAARYSALRWMSSSRLAR
jgi:hypothetical protein